MDDISARELPYLSDSGVQELLLQALRGDEEVEEGHFDRDLRRIVGVGQFAGHVEPEVWVIGDHIVPNLDHLTATLQMVCVSCAP